MVVLVSGDDYKDPRIELFIKIAAIEMIRKHGAILFYTRNCGQFQTHAAQILNSISANTMLYTPFIPCEHPDKPCYNNPAYHCLNEKNLPGYAPHRKDIFMLEACDSLITNISDPQSDSAKLASIALKKGLTVINVLKYDQMLSKPKKCEFFL